MIRHELWRPEGNSADRGFRVAAGGWGECLLLLRLDRALREIAGGLGKDSGWLNWFFGDCGKSLQVGRISGQWEVQVFVVKVSVCGGGEG